MLPHERRVLESYISGILGSLRPVDVWIGDSKVGVPASPVAGVPASVANL